MAVNEVIYDGETLINLTEDSVSPSTLAKGTTAHNAAGETIVGEMPVETVLYVEQTLTDEQQAQARQNIGVDEKINNKSAVRFETVLGSNYQLVSTTCNYAETVAALESGRSVYSSMINEGVENGTMYPTEWKTQTDDPYISFVYHFRNGHEIHEIWMHIRESGNNTTEWRILENSQMKSNDLYTIRGEDTYPSSAAAANYTDAQCGVVLDYMQTTFAQNIMALCNDRFGPHIIYDNPTGFEASNDNAGDTWHLTGLNLSPYKRIKCYVCPGGDSDANYSPEHIVEVHLDDRAKGSFGYFTASHTGHTPNNRNRYHIATFTVNAEKTAIQFQHSISIYGTSATNSVVGRRCYLIEGYLV